MKLKDKIERCIKDQFFLAGKTDDLEDEFEGFIVNRRFLKSLLTNFYNQQVLKKPRAKFLPKHIN
jgi:hypothetical protein